MYVYTRTCDSYKLTPTSRSVYSYNCCDFEEGTVASPSTITRMNISDYGRTVVR